MSASSGPAIIERAISFGEGATMLGITTELAPAAGTASASRPAALILNAGIVHRIGPARNSVELARHLARQGLLVLRFDLTGIGDSESRQDSLSMEEHAVIDVQQAMAHLTKTRGIDKFVLVGLCSGADNAFRVACRDPMVVGAVMIDGYGYRTPEYFVRYYGPRSLRWRNYRGMVRNVAKRLVKRARSEVEERFSVLRKAGEPTKLEVVPQWQRVFPPKEQFIADLRALIARDVRLLFIYTAGVERYYNYQAQLADSLPGVNFRGLVDVAMFADSDHTITELESKAKLRSTTLDWFAKHFPAPRVGDVATVGTRGDSAAGSRTGSA